MAGCAGMGSPPLARAHAYTQPRCWLVHRGASEDEPGRETDTNRGRLGHTGRWFGKMSEAGIPPVEGVGQVVVEHPRSDLEEQVCATR